jgi:hypothetical protein
MALAIAPHFPGRLLIVLWGCEPTGRQPQMRLATSRLAPVLVDGGLLGGLDWRFQTVLSFEWPVVTRRAGGPHDYRYSVDAQNGALLLKIFLGILA